MKSLRVLYRAEGLAERREDSVNCWESCSARTPGQCRIVFSRYGHTVEMGTSKKKCGSIRFFNYDTSLLHCTTDAKIVCCVRDGSSRMSRFLD